MKKRLLFFVVCLFSLTIAFGQNPPAACAEIFISEYVEGRNNNKAIEIFNPTNRVIDLSQYQLARNNNGATSLATTRIPAGTTIQPYKTFVFVLDKRDTTKYTVGLEFPIWDGFQSWDTCRNANGTVQIDSATGRPLFCVQIDAANGNLPKRGTRYNDFLDLKCRVKTDRGAFINPIFDGAMYFNGNDAVMLFKGTPDSINFTNIIDMVGIYNDPGMSAATTWKDWLGRDLTLDRTLVRKREVRAGTGLVAYIRRDTFKYSDWFVFTNSNYTSSFQNLDSHTCDCDPNPPISGRRTCNGTLITAAAEIAPVEFKIYPNPTATRNVSIEADGIISSITVYDLMGRIVEKPNLPIGSESINLNFNNLSSGIFMVKVQTEDNRIGVQKLVIH